jgi:hypothetical protein
MKGKSAECKSPSKLNVNGCIMFGEYEDLFMLSDNYLINQYKRSNRGIFFLKKWKTKKNNTLTEQFQNPISNWSIFFIQK